MTIFRQNTYIFEKTTPLLLSFDTIFYKTVTAPI